MAVPINHPFFPVAPADPSGKVNSGIGVRDYCALEIMKKTVHLFEIEDAEQCAKEAFVFANAYMQEKENNRHQPSIR